MQTKLDDFNSPEKEAILQIFESIPMMEKWIACVIENLIYAWIEEYYSQEEGGKIRCRYLTKYREKHGKYIDWHKNGKKSRECTYKDGKLDGTYKEWTDNGQIITEWTYKEGKFNGLCNDYIRCGYNHPEIDTLENKDIWYKHRITTYKDNIREKCIKLYYKPHTSSFWLNKITEYVHVNNIDADISEEMTHRLLGYGQFKNNKLHGQCIGIDTALNVLVICGYKDGQYHGEHEMWTPNGVLLEHKVYAEGELIEDKLATTG